MIEIDGMHYKSYRVLTKRSDGSEYEYRLIATDEDNVRRIHANHQKIHKKSDEILGIWEVVE